jgi:TolB-like protein
MPAPETDTRIFRFGAFEFNPRASELLKGGTRVSLQPQPAQLLWLLLSKAGEVVTRDTIRRTLWDGKTTVDFELGVNRCIRQLRGALLDSIEAPRYIKTIPHRGYRFIAPVSAKAGEPATEPVPLEAAREAAVETSKPAPSIVVLPFANLSGELTDEYFSDGLAEEITNALTQIDGLKVVARTSAFAFKGKNEDIRRIAETLGVSNVLEGSVRRAGNRIRVTAQLIQAADGVHLSSRRYDREMTDVFAIQDEISTAIADHLKVRLNVYKRPVKNLAAYEAFLAGRFHWYKFTPEGFTKAFECFQRAVAIDADYGPAYTGIALYHLGTAIEYVADPRDVLPHAAAAARRALEIDETDAEAHTVLGDVAAILDFDWAAAERHFSRARHLNPSTQVRIGHALWLSLPLVRVEDALAECDRVIERDPFHLGGYSTKATALFLGRNYDAAVERCLHGLDLDPTFPRGLQILSHIRAFQGHFGEAVALAERLIQVRGKSHGALFALGTAHAAAGDGSAANRVLREMETLPGGTYLSGSGIACIHALLEERDSAFEWMERAIEHRDPRMLWIRTLPWLDALRSDPRYATLLRSMNL